MSKNFATNVPDPHHWTRNSCLGAFYFVWVHLGPFWYCTKLDAKRVEMVQLMQKFVPRSRVGNFATNAPDPHHWTLNPCFHVFLSVWVHLGPFRYCMKLGAKRAEMVQQMQKFLPRSRIRNFYKECSRSTP